MEICTREGATHALMEYPLDLNCRYSAESAAATWSTTGGPVGDPRWTPHSFPLGTDQASVPGSFTLEQNYQTHLTHLQRLLLHWIIHLILV